MRQARGRKHDFRVTLAIALAIHLASIAVIRTSPVALSRAPSAAPAPIETDIDIEHPPPISPASPPRPLSQVPVPVPESTRAYAHDPPSGRIPDTSSGAVPSEPLEPATASSAWSAWSLATRDAGPPDPGPPDLGVGKSTIRDTIARAEPPPEPPSTTKVLREALEAHDRAIGLGSGGPVVEVARNATASSTAPVNGYAVFEAIFDTHGKITSVRVLDVSADHPSWDEVAEVIKRDLGEKTVRVPPASNGVAVSVRVESRWQMPDGSDPDPVKVCVPPFPCNAGPRRKKLVLTPLLLTAPLPTVGDKPLRVVHTYIVAERTL